MRNDSTAQIMNRVLDLLIEATETGKLLWDSLGFDTYRTSFASHLAEITYLHPLLSDDTTSGADIAKISFGGVIFHFFNGTAGMEKINHLLTLCEPRRQEWDILTRDRVLAAEADLKKYLDQSEHR